MTLDQALAIVVLCRNSRSGDSPREAAWELATAIERVRKLHRQVIDSSWPAPGHCEECLVDLGGLEGPDWDYAPYPCPTMRALDGSS